MSNKQRQELFCQYVADGMAETDAVRKAGYSTKGSSVTIQVTRLQNNPAVQKRIVELKAARLVSESNGEPVEGLPDDCNPALLKTMTSIEFLRAVYRNPANKIGNRISAAAIVIPFEEAKVAPVGKKEGAIDDAKDKPTSGKFATFSNQQDFFETQTVS